MSEPLERVDLAVESATVLERHRNAVIGAVNDHVLRLAVFQGQYGWHSHPASDELFLVLEGELWIDFRDRPSVALGPNQIAVVPAGVVHRTRAPNRTVNLCFERATTAADYIAVRGLA